MSESSLPPEAPAPGPLPVPVYASRPTSVLAIVSLVTGILGWVMFPFVGSVAAIITGHFARAEIRRSPGGMEGDGLAIAGLALGWLMVVVTILAILAVLFFLGGLVVLLGLVSLSAH